MVVAVTK